MVYTKNPTTIDDQILILKNRGLIINNISFAQKSLKEIGYFRLENYWHVMQIDRDEHIFKEGQTFERAILLYQFDKELRNLIFKYIEKIEISFRTKMVYYPSHDLGAWWFEDVKNFKNISYFEQNHKYIKESIEKEKKRDDFIKRHYEKYEDDTRLPPAWKTVETLSLGTISKLYSNLRERSLKNKISSDFNLNSEYFDNFLHAITEIRNICAHYGRLWNRKFPTKIKLLKNTENGWLKNLPEDKDCNKIYLYLAYIRFVINYLDNENNFAIDLKALIQKNELIDLNSMGFTNNWEEEDLWK